MTTTSADDVLARLLAEPALEVAPRLLGSIFWSGGVGVRLTEVEAYHGQGQDPGSHAHRGRSTRNGSMFDAGGTLYVYLSYGIHRCVNVVCGPEGYASGVLLRAGEVVAGLDEARARRSTSRTPADLARGPGRLGSALGIELGDDGSRLVADAPSQEARFRLRLPSAPVGAVAAGPRVGVSGHAGGDAFPWWFSLEGDPTVSPYRAAVSRRRGGA
ncbi:DNA-3-methyladenine glycosylase [Frigoribacterium sp. VKM Ac-1396]|uniref:DNA-3-methyladenine glycosylase n=1 Tax=Frigoribacterium sp. VKM Ac-1396 TaxID=2783821 RepID=UPI00351BF268